MYEMSDISKGSTLPRARKDQMELSVEEKLGNETLEAKESPQPTRKQSLVQKAIQSLTPGKHAQYDFLQGSETPPTLRKEPVVLMTVCESSAEDQTDSTTAEATTSGDQQENEGHTVPPRKPRRSFLPPFTARSEKYDVLKASESPPPTHREKFIKKKHSYPILPKGPDHTTPEES